MKATIWQPALQRIVSELTEFHPRAIVLFGSAARWQAAGGDAVDPNDLDLLMVGLNVPFGVMGQDYGVPFEIQFYKDHEIIDLARSLRYAPRPLLLARLYAKTLIQQHARNVICACLLLGPEYAAMGIEQIERNGRTDTRDYSIHQVLYGAGWWQQLCRYPSCRRGPLLYWSDRLAGVDEFQPVKSAG